MVLNFYDIINLAICLGFVFYISTRYQLSDKILYLLLLHVFLLFVVDAFLTYDYWPDQRRYFVAASEFRTNYTTMENTNSVIAASFFFSLFPFFVESIKSIAFMNFILYLIMLIFLLNKIQNDVILHKFKLIYFLYPTLILFTSLGLRDILITFFMFFSLYSLLLRNSIVWAVIWAFPLYFIKGQNLGLILIGIGFYKILSFNNKGIRNIFMIIYILIIAAIFYLNWDLLFFLSQAMFVEDTGLDPTALEGWSYVDIYRKLMAPFFFDARNAMQILQSVENLGILIVIYKLLKLAKTVKVSSLEFISINFFSLISTILYSLVVFNYGTVTRYKFPFVFCWLIIMLLIIDKAISENSSNKFKDIVF